jgi:predicted deacylase
MSTETLRCFVEEDREDRTIIAAAARADVLAFGTELGGAGTATPTTLGIAREGVRAFLAHMGVMAPDPERPPRETRLMEVKGPDHYVHAPTRGLFEPAFALGDTVCAGDVAGWIHQIDDPAIPPVEVIFRGDGLVICWRPMLQVERGDCLAHLATDLA